MLNGLFDSLSNKFTSSIEELIPKAVKESITSHLYADVMKAVKDTLPSYALPSTLPSWGTLVQVARTLRKILSNKFTSSIAELIPKAVKESITSHIYADVKKAVKDTLPSYTLPSTLPSWGTLVQVARTLRKILICSLL